MKGTNVNTWKTYAIELEARIDQIGRAQLPMDEEGSDLGHAIQLAGKAVEDGLDYDHVDDVIVLTPDAVRDIHLRIRQLTQLLVGAS